MISSTDKQGITLKSDIFSIENAKLLVDITEPSEKSGRYIFKIKAMNDFENVTYKDVDLRLEDSC